MREIGCRRTPEAARSGVAGLTRREAEILRLVASGNSNPDVARLLWITNHTVKFHLANAYRKLGIRNRIEGASSDMWWPQSIVCPCTSLAHARQIETTSSNTRSFSR